MGFHAVRDEFVRRSLDIRAVAGDGIENGAIDGRRLDLREEVFERGVVVRAKAVAIGVGESVRVDYQLVAALIE